MKKLALLLCMLCVHYFVQAQITIPKLSPSSKLTQKIGLTDVTIEYSRPSMRGRVIFGGLLPFDKIWRTGANANSTITFSDDVVIDGQTLKAGSYAIYTKPGKTSWDIMFYTDVDNWGTPKKWDDSKVAAKTTVEVFSMPIKVETFTISIDDISTNSAVLGLLWEKTYIGVKFKVPTDATVMSSIEKAMKGVSSNDYYNSALYYLNTGKDINKAKEWIDKSLDMLDKEPAFWQLRQKSLIYAEAGDKKGAIKAAKKAIIDAEATANQKYVKMIKKSLREWE